VFSALNTTLVRDSFAGNREFIVMGDETMLAAAGSDPTGLMGALERTTIDEAQLILDLSQGYQESRSMMIAGPAGVLLAVCAITYQ
jgi:hypothetical protein